MKKTRLVLVGGFLGVGKTTLLLQAAAHLTRQGLRVGLVTNDQGRDLVDTALVQQHELPVQEVAGGCFCCRFPDLLEAVRRLRSAVQPDVVLAEPVGSCTDLMATVLRPILRHHANEFDIAPLTILLDPQRDLGHFPSTVTYLFRQQLLEAEIIALNKCDLLDSRSIHEKIDILKQAYPDAQIIGLSAHRGDGVAQWIGQTSAESSRGSQMLDVDYALYADAEASLGWLNAKIALTGEPALSPSAWIEQIFDSLNRTFAQMDMSVAHLKLHLNARGVSFKASLTETGEQMIWDVRGDDGLTDQAEVILNARVNTTPEKLKTIVQQVIGDICQRHRNSVRIHAF